MSKSNLLTADMFSDHSTTIEDVILRVNEALDSPTQASVMAVVQRHYDEGKIKFPSHDVLKQKHIAREFSRAIAELSASPSMRYVGRDPIPLVTRVKHGKERFTVGWKFLRPRDTAAQIEELEAKLAKSQRRIDRCKRMHATGMMRSNNNPLAPYSDFSNAAGPDADVIDPVDPSDDQ